MLFCPETTEHSICFQPFEAEDSAENMATVEMKSGQTSELQTHRSYIYIRKLFFYYQKGKTWLWISDQSFA